MGYSLSENEYSPNGKEYSLSENEYSPNEKEYDENKNKLLLPWKETFFFFTDLDACWSK